jgi:hypothetical protein
MAATAVPFSTKHIEVAIAGEEVPTHTVRLVLRTTDDSGTNDFVDGTDLYVRISDELWEKVQLLRGKKSAVPEKRFEGEYLLTGFIRCPECGAAMTASRTLNRAKDGKKIVRMYYSCGRF